MAADQHGAPALSTSETPEVDMEYWCFSNDGAELVAEDSVSNFELLQALQTGSPNLDGIAVTQNGAEGPYRERFTCDWPDCTATFARRADYNRHLKERHLPVQRYKCTFPGCNITYYRRDKLRSHERYSHNPKVCISEKDSSSAIPRTIHNIGSLDMIFENHAFKEPATSSSSWTAVDEHARFQDLNSDTNRSSPIADYSCGLSEDFSISSDEISRKGSMSVTSTSSNRTVLSRNRIELLSTSQTEETDHAERKFACPYRKHNPEKYNINNHRTCAASGWDSIPRVKEHLSRHHRVPIQCMRCWKHFNTANDLSRHTITGDLCEERPGFPEEGITQDVERRLMKRKGRDQSKVKKWEEVYSILFPGREVPSPYFVPVEDDSTARDKFASAASAVPIRTSFLEPNEIENGQTPEQTLVRYIREKLPRLFGSRLEVALAREGAPTLDERQKSEMVSIVADCCDDFLLSGEVGMLRNGYGNVRTAPAVPTAYSYNPDINIVSSIGGSETDPWEEAFQESENQTWQLVQGAGEGFADPNSSAIQHGFHLKRL